LALASLIGACAFQQPVAPASNPDAGDDAGGVGTSADADATTGTPDATAPADLVGAGDVDDASGDADAAVSDQVDADAEDSETASGCEGKLGPCNCVPSMEICPCDPAVDSICCLTWDNGMSAYECLSEGNLGYRWSQTADGCECQYPNFPEHCKNYRYTMTKHPGYCGLPPYP
jgi:hypothetical protein